MFFKHLLLIVLGFLPGILTAQYTLSNYQTARALLNKAVAAHGGAKAIFGIQDAHIKLQGTAYDEGQSAGPLTPYFERDMQTEIHFKPRQKWSRQMIHTYTIGGLLYDPVFVLKGDEQGTLQIPSSGELFQLEELDVTILKGIPQLYPPRLFPFFHLQEALRNASSLRYLGKQKNSEVLTYTGTDGTALTIHLDAQKHLLKKFEFLSDHLIFGDIVVSISFENYESNGAYQVPRRLVFKNSEDVFMDLKITDVGFNTFPDAALFEPPADQKFTSLPTAFEPQPIGKGVWFLPVYVGLGITYNSLIVEFEDYFLVADAPFFDGYSNAISQIANSLAAGKPIRYFVPTHCHTDHLGGIGFFIAKGTHILTTKGNETFIKQLSKVKHSLQPTALSRNPTEPIIEAFADKKVLTDGVQKVELYEIKNSPHVDEITVVYLPNQKLLFVADLLMVPHNGNLPADNPSLRHFDQWLDEQGLEVEKFAPGHGLVISKEIYRASLDEQKKTEYLRNLAIQSTDPINDHEAVERAVLDYVEAFYQGDTSKIYRSILPTVNKYGYSKTRGQQGYTGEPMSFQEMLNYALEVKKSGKPIPSSAPKKVELLDVQDQTAAAKLTAWWGTDYVLLGKYEGVWKIVEVLWQSTPKKGD